jgi:hypothetical protein
MLAPLLGGCHRWHPRAGLEPSLAERTLRVTTHSGRRLTLERAVVRSDSVVGRLAVEAAWDRDRWSVDVHRGGDRTAVAVADVQALEEREFDALESAGTFVAVTLALALLGFAAIVYGLRGET